MSSEGEVKTLKGGGKSIKKKSKSMTSWEAEKRRHRPGGGGGGQHVHRWANGSWS